MDITTKNWTPKKAAIADVLDDIFSNAGTKKSSVQDLAQQFDKLGLDAYVGACSYGIICDADFPRENTEQVLATLKERIKEPNISQESFNDAVTRLKDYYSRCEASPYDKMDAIMYKDLPLQFSPKDKLESLNNITIDDIKDFYKEIFEKAQGRIVVSGPFSKHPELKQQIFNSIGSFDTVKPVDVSTEAVFKPVENTEVLTEANNKNQAFIVEGFKFKQNRNLKDTVTMKLMNSILGGSTSSRLFSDLREKRHLAYRVSSCLDTIDDMGVLSLEIETTTENQETGEKTFDNVKKSIEGFNDNIQKLKTEKVSQEELDSAKKVMKSELLSCIETTDGKNKTLATALKSLYGAAHANKMLEMIDEITPEDIYNCANYIFGGKPIYSITATKDTLDSNKEFLDSLKNS
jgi:zinc protease